MIEKIKLVLSNKTYKHIITLLSGTVLAQVIPFLIYPLLTRLYTPESFGVQSLFLTTVSLMTILASFRLEYALMLPPNNQKAKELSRAIVSLITVFSVAVLLLLTIGYAIVNLVYHALPQYNWLFFVPFAVFSQLCILVTTNMLNRNEAFKQTAIISVSQSLASSGLRLMFGFLGFLAFGLIWGYIIAQWVMVFWSLFRFPFVCFSFDWKRIRSIVLEFRQFVYFKTPHAFINAFAVNLPVYILSSFAGNKEVGLFSVGLTLVQTPLSVIISSMYQVLYQKMSAMYNQKQALFPFFKRYFIKTVLLSVPIFIILFFISELLITLVFGSQWAEAAVYLKIMLPYMCVSSLLGPLNFIPDIFSMQKKAMVIEFVFTTLRASSMLIGIASGNIILGLILFSLSGVAVCIYTYCWYYKLVKTESNYE
jgi:O-antigen/teichoic acid export membrane protein